MVLQPSTRICPVKSQASGIVVRVFGLVHRAGSAGGVLFADNARSGGAPNCAPSLCSVAGLLGRSLKSPARTPPASLIEISNGAHVVGPCAPRALWMRGDAELRSARSRALTRVRAPRFAPLQLRIFWEGG
jgi:hypothetical protein